METFRGVLPQRRRSNSGAGPAQLGEDGGGRQSPTHRPTAADVGSPTRVKGIMAAYIPRTLRTSQVRPRPLLVARVHRPHARRGSGGGGGGVAMHADVPARACLVGGVWGEWVAAGLALRVRVWAHGNAGSTQRGLAQHTGAPCTA